MQFKEFTPAKFWSKHEHCLSALSSTLFLFSTLRATTLVQSHTCDVELEVLLKIFLQVHCCRVLLVVSQTGAATLRMVLGWQHEHWEVVLFSWENWTQLQS